MAEDIIEPEVKEAIEAGLHGKDLLKKALNKDGVKKDGVSLLITHDQVQQLHDLGYSKTKINSLKPEEAHNIIENQITFKEEETTNQNPEEKKDSEVPPEPKPEEKKDPEAPPEPKPEEKKKRVPPVLTILQDVRKNTKEDKNINDNIKTIAAMAGKELKLEEEEEEKELDQYDNPDVVKKLADKARANSRIEFWDFGVSCLCCLINLNFDPEFRKRYRLDEEEKKSLKISLYQVYSANRTVVNPNKAFWSLALTSFGMPLFLAIASAVGKYQKKVKEKEERELELHRKQLEHLDKKNSDRENLENGNFKIVQTTTQQVVQPPPPPPANEKKEETPPPPGDQKKKAGRHRLDCTCVDCLGNKKKQKRLKEYLKTGK